MFEKRVANLGECYLFAFEDFLRQEAEAKKLQSFRLRIKKQFRLLISVSNGWRFVIKSKFNAT